MDIDVNALFTRAESAFRLGRLIEARALLLRVRQETGDHPAVLHLLGLVERRLGNGEAARAALARAAALAPGDWQIANNLGNALAHLGDDEAALQAYNQALLANPGFAEARLNRAIRLNAIGRTEEARSELQVILASNPGHAGAWRVLGALERDTGNLPAAANAFDRALCLEPRQRTALIGRGRIALERGEGKAAELFTAAGTAFPDDAAAAIGLAEALEAEGDPAAEHGLAQFVVRHPGEAEAQRVLARIRWEAGDATGFTRDIERALAARPTDPNLHRVLIETLAGADLFARAADAARAAYEAMPNAPEFAFREAIHAGEAGDDERAELAFGAVPPDMPLRRLHEARHRLRRGEYERAGMLLDTEREEKPGGVAAWAFTSFVWRLLGDERAEWLHGQSGIHAARDLGLDRHELERLADLLRQVHVTRAYPIGQSLRGGTQTRGRLFSRGEPEIARLHEAALVAVSDYFAALPPRDETHPLLRYRGEAVRITGSWSVRLTGQGFHVNHIHPEGVLSSACYISLPETMGNDDGCEGWLELGCPPADLRLPLGPLASIEPKPDRLALFPSYLFHGTRPFADGERLTVAFDVTGV